MGNMVLDLLLSKRRIKEERQVFKDDREGMIHCISFIAIEVMLFIGHVWVNLQKDLDTQGNRLLYRVILLLKRNHGS